MPEKKDIKKDIPSNEKSIAKEKEKTEEQKEFKLKDFFKKIGRFFTRTKESIIDTFVYMTMPKEIKNDMIKEAIEEQKKESKMENVYTRKIKMEIINNKELKGNEKLKELSELAHDQKRPITVGLRNGGVMQFEPVGNGVAIKYAEPHLRPGTKDIVYDFAHVGGVLYKNYKSLHVETTDLETAMKVLGKEKGFDRNLFDENALKHTHEERISERSEDNPNSQAENLDPEEKEKLDEAILKQDEVAIDKATDELGCNGSEQIQETSNELNAPEIQMTNPTEVDEIINNLESSYIEVAEHQNIDPQEIEEKSSFIESLAVELDKFHEQEMAETGEFDFVDVNAAHGDFPTHEDMYDDYDER